MSTPLHPLVEALAIDDSFAVLAMAQLPKYRPNGTDDASTTGAIIGTPLYITPPMAGVLRDQIIKFSGG